MATQPAVFSTGQPIRFQPRTETERKSRPSLKVARDRQSREVRGLKTAVVPAGGLALSDLM